MTLLLVYLVFAPFDERLEAGVESNCEFMPLNCQEVVGWYEGCSIATVRMEQERR